MAATEIDQQMFVGSMIATSSAQIMPFTVIAHFPHKPASAAHNLNLPLDYI
jgi:hypothetical protein